jgi:GDP-4-dehydro-6-deoxy-D-mannose reductase
MTTLVTGANGFAGRHLVKLLHDRGEDVVAWTGPGSADQVQGATRVRSVDITDAQAVDSAVREVTPERVYHLAGAAVTRGLPPERYLLVNAAGAFYVADALARFGRGDIRLLLVSSSGVYGSSETPIDERHPQAPSGVYGISKLTAEHLVSLFGRRGIDVRIVRPFNHTGPGQGQGFVAPDLFHRMKAARIDQLPHRGGAPFRLALRGARSVRDFTDVRDVVRAYAEIMDFAQPTPPLNVASGIGIKIGDLAHLMAEVARMEIEFVDDVVALPQSGGGDRPVISASTCAPPAAWDAAQVPGESTADVVIGDASRLRQLTGWEPTIPLARSLEDLWGSLGGVADCG